MLTDEHLYTLTRTEFAKEIGKSREAVKQDMRRGKYRDLYIFKNGQYKFKSRETVRSNQGTVPLVMYPTKKKINRGGHEDALKKGRYPNQAFANHNHMKKFLSLKGKLTPDQLNLVPEIERKVLAEDQKRKIDNYRSKLTLRDNSNRSLKVYTSGLFNESNKGYNDIGYHSPYSIHHQSSKFKPTNRGKKKKVPEYY
jgi:hypothetical protein